MHFVSLAKEQGDAVLLSFQDQVKPGARALDGLAFSFEALGLPGLQPLPFCCAGLALGHGQLSGAPGPSHPVRLILIRSHDPPGFQADFFPTSPGGAWG